VPEKAIFPYKQQFDRMEKLYVWGVRVDEVKLD